MEAKAGENISVKFSTFSSQNSGAIGKHTLKKDDVETTRTGLKVQADQVVFQNVSLEDAGTYTLTCSNDIGKASASFVLDVKGECIISLSVNWKLLISVYL